MVGSWCTLLVSIRGVVMVGHSHASTINADLQLSLIINSGALDVPSSGRVFGVPRSCVTPQVTSTILVAGSSTTRPARRIRLETLRGWIWKDWGMGRGKGGRDSR